MTETAIESGDDVMIEYIGLAVIEGDEGGVVELFVSDGL